MLKRILKKIFYTYKNTSYAQAGEDIVLRFLFNDIGKKKISYLDLGTNIPDYGNNTYWFYRRNCKGVCVEADPTLIRRIKQVRPMDIVLNAGVAVSAEKDADFFVFNEPSISTFNQQEAEARSFSGKNKLVRVEKIPLMNINDIIREHFNPYPDLISIDIEGLDLDVLKSLDFASYPIPVLCVETCSYSENHIRPKDVSIADYLLSHGYIIYADTYINTIFVKSDWFLKRDLQLEKSFNSSTN